MFSKANFNKTTHTLMFVVSLLCLSLLTSCSKQGTDKKQNADSSSATPQEINVYSYRKEALIKPLLDTFTEQTGIQVNLVTSKADALLQRLINEGVNSPADVLISSDAGRLHRAKAAGVLQKMQSSTIDAIVPAHLRDSEGYWTALSQRSRVIFYNKEKVKPSELSSYEGLSEEQWKGRICVRSSNNIYNQSLLAAMIAHHGEAKAKDWAQGIVENFARQPKGNDRDQMKSAALGLCDIAIANTYYFGSWLASANAADQENAKKLGVFYPNQQTQGAHINVSGAGITKHSKNSDNARKLLEFLVSDKAQGFYASINHEYPVNKKVAPSNLVQSWGYPFKADTLALEKLGTHNTLAIKIFDQVAWK